MNVRVLGAGFFPASCIGLQNLITRGLERESRWCTGPSPPGRARWGYVGDSRIDNWMLMFGELFSDEGGQEPSGLIADHMVSRQIGMPVAEPAG